MTDLKDRLAELLTDEPQPPYDINSIVTAGRRARRRRNAAVATAGTLGAAGLTAAVVVPVLATGGNEDTVRVGAQPSTVPTPTASQCQYLVGTNAHRALTKLRFAGQLGTAKSISGHGQRTVVEICSNDTSGIATDGTTPSKSPASSPPYHYSEKPGAIASRLGTLLHERVTGFGLTISYERAFSQESTTPDAGHPSYFSGNVDVHEASGYGDIGVQVTHEVTELVPFDGDCTAAAHCEETKLPDGSVLRTGQVDAGSGDTVLTAEVHRPDGVIVQAQESNYPFGPDAGSQPHGEQPLSIKQLVGLAEDPDFTF